MLGAATPTTTAFPFPPARGVRITDEAYGEGWYGLLVTPAADGLRSTFVVEFADWSVAVDLTSGQRHRLANALAGRGLRSGVRPLLQDGETFVHLTGSRISLTVEVGDHVVSLPVGPKRMLSQAIAEPEAFQPLRAGGLPDDGGSLTIAPPDAPAAE